MLEDERMDRRHRLAAARSGEPGEAARKGFEWRQLGALGPGGLARQPAPESFHEPGRDANDEDSRVVQEIAGPCPEVGEAAEAGFGLLRARARQPRNTEQQRSHEQLRQNQARSEALQAKGARRVHGRRGCWRFRPGAHAANLEQVLGAH